MLESSYSATPSVVYNSTPYEDLSLYVFVTTATLSLSVLIESPPETNITYSAVYSERPVSCTVNWYGYNDSIMCDPVNIDYGTTPIYNGPVPLKPETETTYFVFDGWSPSVGPVTENTVYRAQFVEHNKIIVTFNAQGISPQYLKPGDKITQPSNPVRDGSTFKQWLYNGNPFDFQAPVVEGNTYNLVADTLEKKVQTISK